jgi:predicted DNA-binding WGR domain protein
LASALANGGFVGYDLDRRTMHRAAAAKHADKLVQEKTGKGYVEVKS